MDNPGRRLDHQRPRRVALYARNSVARDAHPAAQLDALRQLAAQRGWVIVGEYVDIGQSGSKDRRPELDKLMAHVHKGGVNVVGVFRFDRFARSVRHLVVALDDFRSRGVDFVSVNDCIDRASTSTGRFTFAIIAAVTELETRVDPGTHTLRSGCREEARSCSRSPSCESRSGSCARTARGGFVRQRCSEGLGDRRRDPPSRALAAASYEMPNPGEIPHIVAAAPSADVAAE